ncbi:hypothetical protein AMTR_s00095p00144800 [Amborella trichopoda]|uniref:F-box domain-containing protein n=1 Tax=Amborella trichopoda TaxID=13333 RepID=W1NP62_AMBTC|nr:hypothetical protein AMTR_s00095p00144800 [Amborella trichopoda]
MFDMLVLFCDFTRTLPDPLWVLYLTAFPDDLVLNILTQLPVQSILNFKAISKSWNETLSSPLLPSPLLTLSPLPHSLQPSLSSSPIEESATSLLLPDVSLYHPSDTLPQLLKHLPDDALAYGLATSNGLICFYYRVSQSYYVGNPAICKYTAVPAPVDCPYNRVVGLGYDPTSCSFKILLHCSPRSDTLSQWCLPVLLAYQVLGNSRRPDAEVWSSQDQWHVLGAPAMAYFVPVQI